MNWVQTTVGMTALVITVQTACGEPPRYTAIDITNWSDAQLETLPFFKRHIFNTPSDAPFGMTAIAASQAGHVLGSVPQSTPYSGQKAVLLRSSGADSHTVEYIDPFGTFSWGYWSCDSKDCHYFFGYVRDSAPSDINWSGAVVGRATVSGSGDYSSDAVYHAYAYDADHGRVDLFPEDSSSAASCINNRGETAGYISGFGAFRRSPDSTVIALDPVQNHTPSPRWMNANGVIIGSHYPSRAFASPGGSATSTLPDLGGFDTVSASDLNDQGWIVGKSGNFGDAETYATIWQPEPNDTWTEFDLVEQLDTPDVLLENAIAIDNTGNIIARGHEDGTDLFSSRLYWLVPEEPLPGWCVPDIGLHPQSSSVDSPDTILTVQIVNDAVVTGYQWRRDGFEIPAEINPSAQTPELVLSDLTPADSGATFDCVIVSDCGSITSGPATLTIEIPCPADVTGDGQINLADLNLILANFGSTTDAGDTNDDGTVDLADLNAVLAAFGQACP